MNWTILIPLKSLPTAKSRLAPASVDADSHRRLVAAIRADTIAAAAPVGRLIVISDRAGDGVDLVQVEAGLNAALREGARYAAEHWPDDGVAALVGDLATLTTPVLAEALSQAAHAERAFAADDAGTGTTLLTALPGVELRPAFGAGSAARHALVATPLTVGRGLRVDIDTPADLALAVELGVGPATSGLLPHGQRGVNPERA